MCNLYRMTRSVAEVAQLFDVPAPIGANIGTEIYPGYPGLVFAEGELRSMVWGFPLALKGKSGQPLKPKPVNNTRTDKLDSGFWRSSFQSRRCLIPLTSFAEAEGPRGAKTRTWMSSPDGSVLTCAGIWRYSAEWGPVYSMIMADANATMQPIHDRMPVIVEQQMRQVWLDSPVEDARRLCTPYIGELSVDRTEQPWVSKR